MTIEEMKQKKRELGYSNAMIAQISGVPLGTVQKIFSGAILKSLDRFLGLVFGLVEGVAVVCIILLILTAQPWFNTDSILKGSLFLKYLEPVISIPKGAIKESVNNASAFVAALGALNV